MTNCQVSLNLNIGPVTPQTTTIEAGFSSFVYCRAAERRFKNFSLCRQPVIIQPVRQLPS
jgi:hypothetical protein